MRRKRDEFDPPSTMPTSPRPTSTASGSTLSRESRLSLACACACACGSPAGACPAAAAFWRKRQPIQPTPPPMNRNGSLGIPGIMASATRIPEASSSGCESPRICLRNVSDSRDSELDRVTIRPPDTEITSAGITVTRPSPMVRAVYVSSAFFRSIPCWKTPMRNPATILMTVMRIPATASPRTNFDAPSMAP